jgi:3D (Asp-Asp-Asp) domain-containing protein
MMSNKEWAVLGVICAIFVALLLIFGEPKTEIIEVEREREIYIVTATVYHAVEEQCDSDCLVTASGAKIASAESAYDHRYIAVSRDLLDVFPYGTRVEVSGCGELDGVYTVADTMNRRYKGYIDLLINPDMRGGKWEGVRIKKVE